MQECELINQSIFEIGKGQWDIPSLCDLLGKVLPDQDRFENYLVKHAFPDIGEHEFLLKGCRVRGQSQNDELILLSFQKVNI